ncbi:MAG: protease complex subunit PrcB family protein [Thermoflexales bacterium]|nr:protease complex subunit PrcB family protein [Thermoflexales bacterium]
MKKANLFTLGWIILAALLALAGCQPSTAEAQGRAQALVPTSAATLEPYPPPQGGARILLPTNAATLEPYPPPPLPPIQATTETGWVLTAEAESAAWAAAATATTYWLITPTPTPSPCYVLAIAHVAREHNIPPEKLIAGIHISNENGKWISDNRVDWFEFPSIKQKVCYVKVSVTDSDALYGVALDEQGRVVDLEKLRALEREANRAMCGKLDAALCAHLPTMAKDEQVEVAIWLKDIDWGAIYDAVAARYPASLQPAKGLPFDADHPDCQQAFQEAEQLAVQAYGERTKPVQAFLEAQGVRYHYASSRSPVVFAEVSSSVIAALANREDTAGIYLLGGELRDSASPAAPTGQPPAAWEQALRGSGGLLAAAMVWGLALALIYLAGRRVEPAKGRLRWIILAAAAALTLPLLYLAVCQDGGSGLPFETVVKGEHVILYGDQPDPSFTATYEVMDLLIAASPAEAQHIADTLSPERPGLRFEIADVDYGEYLVVVAYLGAKPHGGFGITIEKITQAEQAVDVIISTVESKGGDMMVVHPIHAVKIRRAALPARGRLTFNLWQDGRIVLAREHVVP